MSKRRVRKKKKDTLILNLIIMVMLVLVIFEGRLVMTMLTHRSSPERSATASSVPANSSSVETENDKDSADSTKTTPGVRTSATTPLAGLPGLSKTASSSDTAQEPETEAERHPTVSNPDSAAIVPKASEPVDDSYFSDAVFIGDSRMEGFRNISGITQGQFFTSVGMSLSGLISEPLIKTPDGNITVAAAVSGGTYRKIYLMLGTNDLGEYDLEGFHDRFTSATSRLMELQPNAIFYICSIIYVEEAKVTTGDYVNNTNVDKLNAILLQICEEQGYHYLDLNEFLSDGYGSLIGDASSDGIHMETKYCKQMLDYLKNHYVTTESSDTDSADPESETENSDSV